VATTEQSTSEPNPVSGADFGANEWLVEEMYERYLADPNSVDAAWHDFFADYRPAKPAAANGTAPTTPPRAADPVPTPASAAPAAQPTPTTPPPAPAAPAPASTSPAPASLAPEPAKAAASADA